jgi:hypothetical protein
MPQCTRSARVPGLVLGRIRPAPLQFGAVTAPLPDLFLYGRPGCHLCEDARAILDAILARRSGAGLPVPVVIDRNITEDEDWHRRYLVSIPVLALGDRELELATSAANIDRFLAEELDGTAAP